MSISRLTRFTTSSALALGMLAGAAHATDVQALYTFAGNDDGAWPGGNLITDRQGNLYGTTSTGGPNGAGTIFKLAQDGTKTTLYSFHGGNDGDLPLSGLLSDNKGDLFGVTEIGGKFGEGNVFELTPDGVLTSIYDFGTGAHDGGNPIGQLIWGPDHTLLGTTLNAGDGHDGTVFQVTLKGKETILHAFTGADGMYPRAGLVMDPSGNLFGTCFNASGGAAGNGTVFEITSAGVFKTLYNFSDHSGYFLYAPLALDKAGNLYGTAQAGGANNYGTLFKLTQAGKLTVLHAFTNGVDGSEPDGQVFVAANGDLFGTTSSGGKYSDGTIFKYSPNGTLKTLYAFDGTVGEFLQGGLIADRSIGGAWLYGLSYAGGSGNGVVYRVKR